MHITNLTRRQIVNGGDIIHTRSKFITYALIKTQVETCCMTYGLCALTFYLHHFPGKLFFFSFRSHLIAKKFQSAGSAREIFPKTKRKEK